MSERERALLERAREGDVEAFAEFVRTFERRVRSVLSRLLDDERDVEEAAQDAFVQAWRNLHRFRGDAAPFTWLYRIAVNEALQRTRRKRVETRPLDDVAGLEGELVDPITAHPPPADVEAERRELASFVAGRLRELPFELRAPLVLRDVEGWSYSEIADALGVSVAALKSRVHRARLRLSLDVERWLEDEARQRRFASHGRGRTR